MPVKTVSEWQNILFSKKSPISTKMCQKCRHNVFDHNVTLVGRMQFNDMVDGVSIGKCFTVKCKCKEFTLDTIEDFIHNVRVKAGKKK